jgi:methionine-rich copper-binding protein CopC
VPGLGAHRAGGFDVHCRLALCTVPLLDEGIVVPNRLEIWMLIALMFALLAPAGARAHAILEESSPPVGGSVKAGKLDLRLRYNSRIDRVRSRLTLIRPDRSKETVAIVPDGPPDILSARLNLTPGTYIVRWQVLATDGHITRGDVPLTVTAP